MELAVCAKLYNACVDVYEWAWPAYCKPPFTLKMALGKRGKQ